MSLFSLPSVRVPPINRKKSESKLDDEVCINESLLLYIDQLKHLSTESYTRLSTICNLQESIQFFKYVELFQNVPFSRSALQVHCFDENKLDAVKALTLVRGKIDLHENVKIKDADVVVGEGDGNSVFDCVRSSLQHQKQGGSIVLHVADIFTLSMVQLLYLLAGCYTTVCIYTPMLHSGQTKFIVCTNLKQNLSLPYAPPYTFTPTQLFMTKLSEINTIIGQKRLEQTRFNTTCEYECIIWKSKYLNGILHNVNVDTNSRSYQVQERPKTPHGNAVY